MSDMNGDAREGWTTYTLGQLANFINGRAFKPTEWGSTGLPIIRIQNLTNPDAQANYFDGEVAEKHSVDDGDLLVSWSASLDAFLWERGPAALNQHIFKVEENTSLVDRRFFYYALRAVMDTIRSQIHGATMQHITKPKLESTTIALPTEVGEQERLAGELDERFSDIADMHAAARRQREAAFASTGAVLHRALEGVHGSAVKEETLGTVLAKCQYGSSSKAGADESATPMLRMGNIVNGRIEVDDLAYVWLPTKECEKYRLNIGDVLINRTNSAELVGKSAIFDMDGEYVFASYLIRLAPRSDKLLPGYLQALLASSIGRSYIDRVKHQSVGQSNINGTEIKAMKIPLPPTDEQKIVLRELAEAQPTIDAMVAAADQAINALNELPASVLQEVFHPTLN